MFNKSYITMSSNKDVRMAEKIKAGIRASKYLDENSRYDILEMLGRLEGELQAKDIAVAALKSECLKHILYNLRGDRSAIADPYLALGRDATKVEPNRSTSEPDPTHQNVAYRMKVLQNLVESQKSSLKRLISTLEETQAQNSNLIKELDDERRKREQDTAQGDDITYCLEKDRTNLKKELEAEAAEKTRLQSEVEQLKEKLKTEQVTKMQIIVTLIEDRKKMAALYLEEEKRSEDLNRLLRDERAKVNSLGIGLEEESKRSLAMEEELERCLKQARLNKDEISNLRVTQKELEDALRRARQEADHFKKQLAEAHRVAMSQASTNAVAAAVAPQAPPMMTQQPQQSAFMQQDPMNDPYPKWTPTQLNVMPSTADVYQAKSPVPSIYDQDASLNNNRSISTGPPSLSRGLVAGVALPVVGNPILSMPGSSDTTRLKGVGPVTSVAASVNVGPAHAHTKMMHHTNATGGKKVGLLSGGSNIKVAGGVPPPVPPNKPAMSALYKPMAAAAASAASALKIDSAVAELGVKK